MLHETNKLISVIVPCYNAEETIVVCLESIASQTYGNIEIVLIDDCSTDRTSDVIEAWKRSAKVSNMVFIRNEVNSGVSFSRNRGLDAAHGSYVMFVDADDYLDGECCSRLASMMSGGDVQCSACNAMRILPDGSQKTYFRELHDVRCFSGREYSEKMFDAALFDTSWAKLYDLSFIRSSGLRFTSSISFGEDTLFANLVALNAGKIAVCTSYSGYFYKDNPNGCCNTITTRKRLKCLEQVLFALRDAVQSSQSRLLLRKSKEYIWTIKRGERSDSGVLVKEMISSALWKDIVFPAIVHHGSLKHRLLVHMLNKGFVSVIRLW